MYAENGTHRQRHTHSGVGNICDGGVQINGDHWLVGLCSRKADCSGTQTIVQHHTDFKHTHTHTKSEHMNNTGKLTPVSAAHTHTSVLEDTNSLIER